MDPITQGLLGGVIVQASLGKRAPGHLTTAGVLGAMAPDLDILIRSSQDPLLSLQFHRHFTHSFFFIPLGALAVTALLFFIWRRKVPFGWLYLATFLGFASHGLLDALTSYGTVLLWPFSLQRISLDTINVIDPIFSTLLFFGFVGSIFHRKPRWARVALLLATLYLGFGYYQSQRALGIQAEIAQSRGHTINNPRAIPSLGNILVWRSIYQQDGDYYVDAIRIVPGEEIQWWEGGSLEKFISPSVGEKLKKDLDRFQWFSEGKVAVLSRNPWVVGDIRFSVIPHGTNPLWGVAFEGPDASIRRIIFPYQVRDGAGKLWSMILGELPGSKPYPP